VSWRRRYWIGGTRATFTAGKLPGVAELLRPAARGPAVEAQRQASGRESHPQKITVYLSGSELLDLERSRLTLRALGLTVDRGRIVREALAMILADLGAQGERSLVARRLQEGTLRMMRATSPE